MNRFTLLMSGEYFDELEIWSRSRIEEYQLKRIRRLIEVAKRASNFYKTKFRDLNPDEVSSLKDFAEVVPLTSKKELISATSIGGGAVSDDDHIFFTTRGTTGETLIIPQKDEELEEYVWPAARGLWWAGLRPSMRVVMLSPAWHRLAACEAGAVGLIGAEAIYFWGSSSEKYVRNFLNTIRESKAQFLSITTPFLLTIFWKGQKRALEGVEKCITVGAPISPMARKRICEELGVGEIYERGGTQEGAAIDECRFHEAHHVHEDVCLLEVIRDDGYPAQAGEVGRLAVTGLYPGSIPIIRYLSGDLAVMFGETCGCGRELRRIELIDREDNAVVVGWKRILPYQIRQILDMDEEFCCRNFLLVKGGYGRLHIIVEGSVDTVRLKRLLEDQLDVEVMVESIGSIPIRFGYRPVIDRQLLENLQSR
jgi:phenylacetate-CoA ligase